MVERNKRKVNVTDRFHYAEKLDAFISLLQHARTEVNRRGWVDPMVEIETEPEFDRPYIQVIAWRDETDSELHVRQLVEESNQRSREWKEKEELKRLLEKYGDAT